MKRLRLSSMPLLLRLLLALTLLMLAADGVRTALLWREEVLRAQDNAQGFLRDFVATYQPKLEELSARGLDSALQELLDHEAREFPMLASITWQRPQGQLLHAQAPPITVIAPDWVMALQRMSGVPNRLLEINHQVAFSQQGQLIGTLHITLTPVPELNRIWLSVRQQLWTMLGMLVIMMGLIALVLRSSLRGLTELSRAAMQLPAKPEIRIRPGGAHEIRRLGHAFNAMAGALQKARAVVKEQLERTTWMANHDALTGLPNRPLLADRLGQALRRCERHQELIGVCFIDLDNFKPINDQHGHTVGDEVLMTAARRMKKELRETDTLARIGGDEFVLLLTSLKHPAEARAVVERVLASLREPIDAQGLQVNVTGSAGLTTQSPIPEGSKDTLLDPDQLLRQADQMMYQAKQAGRNQLKVWASTQVEDPTPRQQQQVERLLQAIDNNELRLHYQPKVHIRTGKLVGLEALIRWQHPDKGLILPGDFLPLIENNQAIVRLGQWVVVRALRQMQIWKDAGVGWPVSVNIAARQFVQPEFIDELGKALAKHPGVSPDWLTLEILETSSLDDMVMVRAKVEAAQAMGVHCALDDFGTGYSSLSYLKQLPVHEIKIDQSFVRGMLDDHGDLALVEGIVTLAKVFSRRLVAEGVESVEHGVLLQRMGCSVAQGWAIAKPMAAELVPGWEKKFEPAPMWRAWAKVQWNLNHFPVLVAARDHEHWLRQVGLALEGQPNTLKTDGSKAYLNSRFGAWYQRLGDKHFGHINGVHETDRLIHTMYLRAAELKRLCDSGESDRARMIGEELRRQSPTLLEGIRHLQGAVLSSPTTIDTNF